MRGYGTMPHTKMALCADDFGYRAGVSQGIAQLIETGRLTATSALVTFPDFLRSAPRAKELAALADIGLHIDLVEGAPLTVDLFPDESNRFAGLKPLIRQALMRQVDVSAVQVQIQRQIEAFRQALGRDPDFIDGHQHAHALPQVRSALIRAMQACHLSCPVRNPADSLRAIIARGVGVPKTLIIHALTRGMGRCLAQHNLPSNDSFSGAYDLRTGHDCSGLLRAFMRHKGQAHLVMCHPGLADEQMRNDPIADARLAEYTYLASPQFLTDCASAQTRLVRLTDLLKEVA